MALCIILLFGCSSKEEESLPVRYRVTFTFHWNNQDFPLDYPSNAHFSKLIGWSHVPTTSFFKEGTIASEGIEMMAETGATTPLDEEINSMIGTGEGFELVIGDYLNSGTGNIEVEIQINRKYSVITLATMLAPSPDWYVAVVNINLLEDGKFINEKVVEGVAYDAGTDIGITYNSENEEADPHLPISLLVEPPLGNGLTINHSIATVKFSKQ